MDALPIGLAGNQIFDLEVWNHVVLNRLEDTLTYFFNAINIGQATASDVPLNFDALFVGQEMDCVLGCLQEHQILNGQS